MNYHNYYLKHIMSLVNVDYFGENYWLHVQSLVDLGRLVVSVLATGPKVRGFDPDRGRWIFKDDKNPSTTSFGGPMS
jgi:hypothetical protein